MTASKIQASIDKMAASAPPGDAEPPEVHAAASVQARILTPHEAEEPTVMRIELKDPRDENAWLAADIPATKLLQQMLAAAGPLVQHIERGMMRWERPEERVVRAGKAPPEPDAKKRYRPKIELP